MSSENTKPQVEVIIGLNNNVSFSRKGRSSVILAMALGFEYDAQDQVNKIYLDRKVHADNEFQFIGWSVSGAISTILTRSDE